MAFSAGTATSQQGTGNRAPTKLYDFTQLDALARCEVEFSYRYQQHLQRAAPDPSAHFGTAVHAGVRALFDEKPVTTHEDEPCAMQAVSEAWADGVEGSKKPHLTLKYAQEVVKMYAEVHFPSKQFELVLNEQYLEWPERSLCGIVDRVVRSKADGQLYVMDLKTTGLYLSGAWFEQYRHSLQAAIYLDLVEHTQQCQVAGFWVDAIHVDRRGYPKPEDFMRVGPFAYSKELRNELRFVVDDLVCQAKGLDRGLEERTPIKNPRSCFRFNQLCSFFQFCTLEPADRADAVQMGVMAGDFQVEEWVPALRK